MKYLVIVSLAVQLFGIWGQAATTTQPQTTRPGCSFSANVIFVLDESGSIGYSNYQVEKDFVKKIIQGLDISPNETRVGVVEYASHATESIKLGSYSSKSDLLLAVDALTFSGGGTYTSMALQKAYDILRNASSQADRQIIILLSDGQSSGGIASLTPVVERIKRDIRGLTMMAVGIGSYRLEELNLIATDPNRHVFTVSGFNQLIALTQQLMTRICEAPAPTTEAVTTTQPPTTSQVDRICVNGKPCYNHGTCLSYWRWWYLYCSCPYGFAGSNCETNLKVKVTCTTRSMEIVLKRQYFRYIDWRNLHLNSRACRAAMNSTAIFLSTPLNGCGTNYTEDSDIITFNNTVMNDYTYTNQSVVITRESSIVQQFHCTYSRQQLVSTSFKPSKEILRTSEGSFGNFTFQMHICKSSYCRDVYLPYDYPVKVSLGQAIKVQYKVINTINELWVFAEHCHASPSTDPNSNPKYEFLKNGCPNDNTMIYNYIQSSSVQQFSINAFRFIRANDKQIVYIHCKLMVCHLNSPNSRCSLGCQRSRRRRRAAAEYNDTSNSYDLSTGPITEEKSDTSETDQNKGSDADTVQGMAIGLGVLGGVLVVLSVAAILKFISAKVLKSRKVGSAPAYAVKDSDGPTASQVDESPPAFPATAFDGPAAFHLNDISKPRELEL